MSEDFLGYCILQYRQICAWLTDLPDFWAAKAKGKQLLQNTQLDFMLFLS